MKQTFDLVIFGGTGDLSMRKLLPAMYRAYKQGACAEDSRILLCCRKQSDFDNLLSMVKDNLAVYLRSGEFDEALWQSFKVMIRPVLVDLVDIDKGWDAFTELFSSRKETVRLFYLAVMPSIYGDCCHNLYVKNLISENTRLVVEKPLGYDEESAEAINQTMSKYFREEQIYRIDHYLGKETVQNLLTLRFSNFLFENIWDSKSIDHVQISISEEVGVEERAEFYDGAGAMRDMIQNHLLQLLCFVAMESPNRLHADDIRIEKIKVLRALKPLSDEEILKNVVRGQYVSGQNNGQKVPGYLDELETLESNTETYVAMKAFIANWRWTGVPFYLRTGKRLKQRSAEIIIQFKEVTHNIYSSSGQSLVPNRLIIQLQPQESIQQILMAKDIGSESGELKPYTLNLDFSTGHNELRMSAYQRLLLDAIKGDPTLFIHRDEVQAAWQWVDPIIHYWQRTNNSPELYSAGSWGPKSADELFEKKHQSWVDIKAEHG